MHYYFRRVFILYNPVMAATRSHEFDSAVHGFHQYQSIWTSVIGEEFPSK